ncbi:MAG TPA: PEGA domain-containing protein [Polyangiaceae bacterium]
MRSESRRAPWLGLALAAWLAAPPPAAAQGPPKTEPPTVTIEDAARKEAARRFTLGTELYDEGNFDGALIEFRKAYEITSEYRVLYDIGQVCFQLRDYVCALSSFQDYLQRGGAEVPEKRRADVGVDIDRLRQRIGTVQVTANVAGATVTIDEQTRGKTPLAPVPLSAGQHRLVVSMEGKASVSRPVLVAGEDAQTVKVDLVDLVPSPAVAPPVVAALPAQEPPAPAPVAASSRWTTLSFVGLGATGALAVGAGIAGGLALGASSDLSKQTYVGAPSDAAKSEQARVNTLRLTSDLLSAAAIATLATTLVVTFAVTPRASSQGVRAAVGVSGTGVLLRGEF